jgi:hypothetical protein
VGCNERTTTPPGQTTSERFPALTGFGTSSLKSKLENRQSKIGLGQLASVLASLWPACGQLNFEQVLGNQQLASLASLFRGLGGETPLFLTFHFSLLTQLPGGAFLRDVAVTTVLERENRHWGIHFVAGSGSGT